MLLYCFANYLASITGNDLSFSVSVPEALQHSFLSPRLSWWQCCLQSIKLLIEPTLCCPDFHSSHRVSDWGWKGPFKVVLIQPPAMSRDLSLIQVAQGPLQPVLEHFQDGTFTVLLSNLLNTLIVKSVFLICYIKVICNITSSLKPFPLFQSLNVNSLSPYFS